MSRIRVRFIYKTSIIVFSIIVFNIFYLAGMWRHNRNLTPCTYTDINITTLMGWLLKVHGWRLALLLLAATVKYYEISADTVSFVLFLIIHVCKLLPPTAVSLSQHAPGKLQTCFLLLVRLWNEGNVNEPLWRASCRYHCDDVMPRSTGQPFKDDRGGTSFPSFPLLRLTSTSDN